MKALLFVSITVLAVFVDGRKTRECILDVGFILDGSRDVKSWNWFIMLSFVKTFGRHVRFGPSGTRIGVVTYGSRATVAVKLNSFDRKAQFAKAVTRIPYKDADRQTAAGIKAVREHLFTKANGDRPDIQNVVILITGGESMASLNDTIREARALKDRGINIFVIAVSPRANLKEAKAVASLPLRQYLYKVKRFVDLGRTVDDVVKSTCQHQAGTVVWSCSFETKPYRCNIKDEQKAKLIWTRWSSSTPTRGTGPKSAYDGKYYVYLKASNERAYGDQATMYLPIVAEGAFCLSFYYHMFGKDIGELQVFVWTKHGKNVVWTMSGEKGSQWILGETSLDLRDEDRVGIRAVYGFGKRGDIALDYFRLRRGFCSEDV